jgi:hypothetical protein
MSLVFDELPIAFPWYDKIEKQQKYRDNQKVANSFRLITPSDALLPFEILVPEPLPVTSWMIYDCCDTPIIDLSPNISFFKGRNTNNGTYIYYNGNKLSAIVGGQTNFLKLLPGEYYSVIKVGTVYTRYSERFYIPESSFSVNDPATSIPYLKVVFSNSCDIDPVLYAGPSGDFFTQVVYLDTFIHQSDPEFEEDGERDANDNVIPSFQKMVVNYTFSVAVTDFIKIALTSLQMHSSITVTTAKGVRIGNIEGITTSAAVQDNGVFTVLDIKFRQIIMTKHGCCDNMSLSGTNEPTTIIVDDGTPTANIKSSYQVPSTANSAIIAISDWMLCIVPVTPGVRYYINNWNSSRRELGFYGAGDISSPTTLAVISSSQVTKIANDTGAYTVVAPSGAAYMAFNIRNAGAEGTDVLTGLVVWATNPDKPYLIRVQTLTTDTTKITAGITQSMWGTIQASDATSGPWITIQAGLTPAELLAGVTVSGNYAYWRVGCMNYDESNGYTPYLARTS